MATNKVSYNAPSSADALLEIHMTRKLLEESRMIFSTTNTSLEDAIIVFLEKAVSYKGFPFDVSYIDDPHLLLGYRDMLDDCHSKGLTSGSEFGWMTIDDFTKRLCDLICKK